MGGRAQLACAWCGLVMVVATLGGWVLAGVLPFPPAASAMPAQAVAFYTHDPTLVRFGLMVSAVGLCFVGPFVAVIGVQMFRMEQGRAPILSVLQLVCGAVTWVMLIVPMIMLNVAAFRPERSPELTQALTDLAWILFFTPVGPFVIQNVAIGAAVLGDRSGQQVFPRWSGYANFWVGLLFLPAVLAYFFKTGPFAWQGIMVFWLGTVAYAAWAVLMLVVLRRAIRAQEQAGGSPGGLGVPAGGQLWPEESSGRVAPG